MPVSPTAVAPSPCPPESGRLQRVRGAVRLSVHRIGGASALAGLYQSGSGKCLLPRCRDGRVEAVLLNTAGGLTGGDQLTIQLDVGPGGRLIASSQAAERIYRSTGDDASISSRLTLAAGARLDWLAQETIAFEGARLRRSLHVDMAPDATLLAVEPLVLGRTAMGETVRSGRVSDQWRVRRGGRLVFADALRLESPIDRLLATPASAGGARAMATVLLVSPDAEERLDEVRSTLASATDAPDRADSDRTEAAASAWNGLLCVRLLSHDSTALRRRLCHLLTVIRGEPLPRVWAL
ncbi:MAG: urease accessory protein UreD [Xanthomonadaceae bacterium]|nr:urease accessory protein UreD [Xanthomonadaceae bacterium]